MAVHTIGLYTVATGAKNISLGPLSCFRALNQDLALTKSPGLASPWTQAIHISLFLTTLIFSELPLSLVHEQFCLSSIFSPCTCSPYWCKPLGPRALGWVSGSSWLRPACPSHGMELLLFFSFLGLETSVSACYGGI